MPHASPKNKSPLGNVRFYFHIPFASFIFRIIFVSWAAILEILKDSQCPAHFPLQVQIVLGVYRLILMATSPIMTLICKKFGKKHPHWLESIGFYSTQRPSGTVIWIHGTALGKFPATLHLIQHIQKREPNTSFLLTGYKDLNILQKQLPPRTSILMWPLDSPFFTERFLDHWKPDAACIIKEQLWPNLLISIHHRSIPLISLEFSLSSVGLKAWQILGKTLPTLLALFDGIWMKDTGPAYAWGTSKGLIHTRLMPSLDHENTPTAASFVENTGTAAPLAQQNQEKMTENQHQLSEFLDTVMPTIFPTEKNAGDAGEKSTDSLQ